MNETALLAKIIGQGHLCTVDTCLVSLKHAKNGIFFSGYAFGIHSLKQSIILH